jgi:hypothetical protein
METKNIYALDELIPSESVHWDIPNIALYSLSMIILIYFSNPSCIKAGYPQFAVRASNSIAKLFVLERNTSSILVVN